MPNQFDEIKQLFENCIDNHTGYSAAVAGQWSNLDELRSTYTKSREQFFDALRTALSPLADAEIEKRLARIKSAHGRDFGPAQQYVMQNVPWLISTVDTLSAQLKAAKEEVNNILVMLPKTIDGAIIIPGTTVFRIINPPTIEYGNIQESLCWESSPTSGHRALFIGPVRRELVTMDRCFSTRDAAIAALSPANTEASDAEA